MRIKNFGFGFGWHKTDIWALLPTLELHLMGDKYFTKYSWNLIFTWLKGFVEFGYFKLRKEESKGE